MRKGISWVAYLLLFIAFVIGQQRYSGHLRISDVVMPEFVTDVQETATDDFYTLLSGSRLCGYLYVGSAQGYGGPLSLAVFADSLALIQDVQLVHHVETYSFIERLTAAGYFSQYKGKALTDPFILDKDINAVSGATVSSYAIAQASQEASYAILEKGFRVEAPLIKRPWKFGFEEIAILAVCLLAVVATFYKIKFLRTVSLLLSFILIGFVFNSGISVAHIGRVLLGYIPDWKQHIGWWILMLSAITTIVVWGKNVYCHAICPFHASQMLLNRISGVNLKYSLKLGRIIKRVSGVLLWCALMLIFLSSNPTIASYEPFAMLFSLEGYGIQWYILPAVLIASLFVSDFFCRYLCPVGAALKWLQKQRRFFKSIDFKSFRITNKDGN